MAEKQLVDVVPPEDVVGQSYVIPDELANEIFRPQRGLVIPVIEVDLIERGKVVLVFRDEG